MSRTSHNDSNSESEEEEDIDGLIASVLQDIEIKDSMNEGPEGSNVTAHTKPTNTKPTNTNNNSKDSNENIDMDTIPPIPSNTPNSIPPKLAHSIMKGKRYPVSLINIQPPPTEPLHEPVKVNGRSHSSNNIPNLNNINTIKQCIKKISIILSEVDEDKNGEIDYEEFNEGIRNINNNLLPNEIKEMYSQIVWNEYDELNIKLFIDLLKQRLKNIKNIHTISKNIITQKYILNIAFKNDIFMDKSPSHSPDPSAANSSSQVQLNKIYKILKEKDDDNNLYIDRSEFEEAMEDLGVKISRNNLKLIWKLLIKKQKQNADNAENNEELNIKTFMFELSKLKGIESMECNQILQFMFTPMIPINKTIRKYDYNNHINRDYNTHKHKKKKSKHHRNIQSHANISFNHRNKHKKNRKHNRFASMTNLNNISIMTKPNCSLIVISALQKQLAEVDENGNNLIDFAEFNEVLYTLKTSINKINLYKIFYDLTNNKDELNINVFIDDIKNYYKLYPTITGDVCIQKVAENKNQKVKKYNHKYKDSLSSTQSSMKSLFSTQASMISLDNYEMDEKKSDVNNIHIIKELEEFVNQCDSDENGLIDKQELIDILKEYNIYNKFKEAEIDVIYTQLIIRNNSNRYEEASCSLLINKIHAIYINHPHYTARKAVYKVCKKLLKNHRIKL